MSKFSDATFYLAPSGYKEGILFPQKPLSTNGEITFTRASSAWRTNIEGQLEETCYNLLQYSEEFDNSGWSKPNMTTTTNATVAPNGSTTAELVTKTSGVNTVAAVNYSSLTYRTTGIHTLSVYVKPNVGTSVQLRLDNSNNTANAEFNFTTKSFSNAGANFISSSYQEVGNGWFRLSLTGNVTSTAWTLTPCLLFGNPTNDSMYIWGAQLVQGPLPKPYLSTTNRQNFPSVDYSLGTGTFLLEPQRTNIHLNSNSMYNMLTFGSTLPTVTQATTFLDPSASYNAALVTGGSGSSGSWGIFTAIPTVVTSGQIVVVSCYVKAGTHDKVMLQHANVTITGGAQAYFDLATGTTPTSGASIQAVGNGWYRCIIQPVTFTANSNPASYNIGCYITPSTSTNTWSSDFTGKSVYFYGIQVEVGSYATSLIPTTSSAATRIADSFSRGNIYTNNLISASGGTWFVELRGNLSYTRDSSIVGMYVGNTTLGNDNSLVIRSASAPSRLSIAKYVGGAFTQLYLTITDTIKVAIKWNGSTADVFVNGVKQVSATSFTATNMEYLATPTTQDVPKFIQQMALWRTPLTDAQCQELTL